MSSIHTSSLRCSLLKHIRACCEPWEMDYSKAFQRIPIEPPADVPQPRWEGFRNDAVELLDRWLECARPVRCGSCYKAGEAILIAPASSGRCKARPS